MLRTKNDIINDIESAKSSLKSECMFCNEKNKTDQYTTQGTYVSTKVTCVHGYLDFINNPYAGASGNANSGNESCQKLNVHYKKKKITK